MKRKIRVGVIFGGRSGEHEVSLVSATSVMEALDRKRYEVVPIGITKEGRWVSSPRVLPLLKKKHILDGQAESFLVPEPNRRGLMTLQRNRHPGARLDVIFPVVHGTYGEDGSLQGLLELANIPYVGAGVIGSALGMDKIIQKQLFEQAGLPVVRYVWFLSGCWKRDASDIVRKAERALGYPMFVKPANTGSSVGISKAHTRRELRRAVALAAEFDRKVIIEEGIGGIREIECSVLGNDEPVSSIPGEIIPSNEFYDYDAKYVDGKSRAVIPAVLPQRIASRVRALAVRAFRVLDCAGMARVDFFVTTRRPKIYLNEINTIPGFTSISMYPKLWEASGLSYARLLDRLIALAIARHRERARLRTSYDPGNEWYRQ